jgi:hypothetical protein
MATMLDLAKEAFNARNFFLACEIFEGCLSAKDNSKSTYNSKIDSATGCNLDVYYGYGDSLARMGRLKEAFDCYAHIIDYLCGTLAPDRLKHLAYGLIECVLSPRTNTNTNTNSSGSNCTTNSTVADCSLSFSADIVSSVDPLCCPICEDILKFPVTAVCSHLLSAMLLWAHPVHHLWTVVSVDPPYSTDDAGSNGCVVIIGGDTSIWVFGRRIHGLWWI